MSATTWRRFRRLSVASRVFMVVVLATPLLWQDNLAALAFVGILAAILLLGAWAQLALPGRAATIAVLEALAVGAVAGAELPQRLGLLPVLALPPFLAGLRHGYRGVAATLAAELFAVIGAGVLIGDGLDSLAGTSVFTWATMGLGLGLVAGFVHATSRQEPDPEASYRAARRLLTELLDLSEGLNSGLDPVSLASSMLTTVRDGIPARSLAIHARRDESLTPLVREGVTGAHDGLAAQVLVDGQARIVGQSFAFPLRGDGAVMGVVAGELPEGLAPERIGLPSLLDSLPRLLRGPAIRLETALLFAAFRDSATVEERRRLAREMHDGMAQDIASMGYLVDGLLADPELASRHDQLELLRTSITSVVAEVRRSVLTLRSQTEGNASLGATLGNVARHLSAVSGVPIEVTVDEGTTRLRPEVEAELMRIAQEALNNAVRHAEASTIRVSCRVDPPLVELTVADDGRGIRGRRVDSHGLEIMQERARQIGAEIHIGERSGGGTQVSVRIGGGSLLPAPDRDSRKVKVGS